MRVQWSAFGNFWRAKAPWSTKRLAFQINIQSKGLAGLESNILSATDYDELDKVMLGMLKSMMQGSYVTKTTDEAGNVVKYKRQSNAANWFFWRLADTRTELRVRRLKWYQTILREPENNEQIL